MELRDIEYFIAVAERGHVGRAAESLGLSQPALSKSLRRLEASMDTKLVKRTPKGVELTAVGTAFYSHVRRLRLSLDDIAHEVEDLTKGRAGYVQVGVSSPAVDYLLSPAVGSLLNSTPKVTLKVIVGPHDVLMPALRNGQVDLIVSGVVSPVEQGFVDVHLCDDEYFVYASTRHKLAGRKRVTLPDIAAERWAMSSDTPPRRWLHRVFQDNGLPPPVIALESSSLSLRLRSVASSDLLDFLPGITARNAPSGVRLAELQVKELAWQRALVARYRKDAYLSPAAKRLIEILKATAQKISTENR